MQLTTWNLLCIFRTVLQKGGYGYEGSSWWQGLALCRGPCPRSWRGSSPTLASMRPCGLHGEKKQAELQAQTDNRATELCPINEDQKVALDLYPYMKKLLSNSMPRKELPWSTTFYIMLKNH